MDSIAPIVLPPSAVSGGNGPTVNQPSPPHLNQGGHRPARSARRGESRSRRAWTLPDAEYCRNSLMSLDVAVTNCLRAHGMPRSRALIAWWAAEVDRKVIVDALLDLYAPIAMFVERIQAYDNPYLDAAQREQRRKRWMQTWASSGSDTDGTDTDDDAAARGGEAVDNRNTLETNGAATTSVTQRTVATAAPERVFDRREWEEGRTAQRGPAATAPLVIPPAAIASQSGDTPTRGAAGVLIAQPDGAPTPRVLDDAETARPSFPTVAPEPITAPLSSSAPDGYCSQDAAVGSAPPHMPRGEEEERPLMPLTAIEAPPQCDPDFAILRSTAATSEPSGSGPSRRRPPLDPPRQHDTEAAPSPPLAWHPRPPPSPDRIDARPPSPATGVLQALITGVSPRNVATTPTFIAGGGHTATAAGSPYPMLRALAAAMPSN